MFPHVTPFSGTPLAPLNLLDNNAAQILTPLLGVSSHRLSDAARYEPRLMALRKAVSPPVAHLSVKEAPGHPCHRCPSPSTGNELRQPSGGLILAGRFGGGVYQPGWGLGLLISPARPPPPPPTPPDPCPPARPDTPPPPELAPAPACPLICCPDRGLDGAPAFSPPR